MKTIYFADLLSNVGEVKRNGDGMARLRNSLRLTFEEIKRKYPTAELISVDWAPFKSRADIFGYKARVDY